MKVDDVLGPPDGSSCSSGSGVCWPGIALVGKTHQALVAGIVHAYCVPDLLATAGVLDEIGLVTEPGERVRCVLAQIRVHVVLTHFALVRYRSQ